MNSACSPIYNLIPRELIWCAQKRFKRNTAEYCMTYGTDLALKYFNFQNFFMCKSPNIVKIKEKLMFSVSQNRLNVSHSNK